MKNKIIIGILALAVLLIAMGLLFFKKSDTTSNDGKQEYSQNSQEQVNQQESNEKVEDTEVIEDAPSKDSEIEPQKEQEVTVPKKKTFQEVNYSELKNVVNQNEKNIIFIGRDDCSHCVTYKPIIIEVAIKYGLTIYYINTNNITSIDEFNELLTFFDTNATPTTAIVSGGRIIDKHIGNMDQNSLIEFLNKSYF